MKVAGVTAGEVAARVADKQLPASVSPLLKSLIIIASGVLISEYGGKNQLIQDFGDGMVAAGGGMFAKQIAPQFINGIEGIGANDNVLAAPDGDYVSGDPNYMDYEAVVNGAGVGGSDTINVTA